MRISFIQKFIDKIRGKKEKYKEEDVVVEYFPIKCPVGHDTEIMQPAYVDINSKIGNYTFIGYYSNITKAKIGNYCSIGNFVSIGPGEHKQDRISTSHFFAEKNNYEELTQDDCVIGNDVWIGTQSIIKRGVRVGNGAIIGANSFVNKDVPDFAVVAGSPAKVIRYRFEEDKIKKIQQSHWWDYNLIEAKEIIRKIESDSND